MSVEDAFIPTEASAQDWERNFAYQVANIYDLKDIEQVQVLSLTSCESNNSDSCRQVMTNHRRLEANRLMRIKFRIVGDAGRTGAFYINRFQELVVSPQNPLAKKVTIFRGAKVHEMNALECGMPLGAPRSKEAEMAAMEEESAA